MGIIPHLQAVQKTFMIPQNSEVDLFVSVVQFTVYKNGLRMMIVNQKVLFFRLSARQVQMVQRGQRMGLHHTNGGRRARNICASGN